MTQRYLLAGIFYAAAALAVLYLCLQIFSGYRQEAALYDPQTALVFGAEGGDLTVVEFMDYTCPYCRETHPVLMEAIRQDGHVRLLVRPVGSQRPGSTAAAHLAFTASAAGKAAEAHEVLITSPVESDEAVAALAKKLELPAEKAAAAGNHDRADALVRQSRALFVRLGLDATPTFLIGRKGLYRPEGSMPTVQDYRALFDKARGAP